MLLLSLRGLGQNFMCDIRLTTNKMLPIKVCHVFIPLLEFIARRWRDACYPPVHSFCHLTRLLSCLIDACGIRVLMFKWRERPSVRLTTFCIPPCRLLTCLQEIWCPRADVSTGIQWPSKWLVFFHIAS